MKLELIKAEDIIKSKDIHPETVKEFAEKLKRKYYKVAITNNSLPIINGIRPTRDTSIYRPDIIASDKSGNIEQIWEIESHDGGKSMVGAIFLADACISKHIEDGIQDSNIKPDLIFVILGAKYNAMKRIEAIQPYLKTITHINCKIYTKNEAYKGI